MIFKNPFPPPKQLKEQLPLREKVRRWLQESRSTAKALTTGQDRRLALIVGPCSIHDLDAAFEYAARLQRLSARVSSHCVLVMRAYVMKPRTTLGWKGLLYDPHLDGSYNIAQGLRLTRQLFLTLAEMQVPTATECVEPILTPYFEDLLTWGFIGARTCASPPHRELASALDLAMGIKNSLDGSLQSAIHGIVAARAPHALVGMDEEGRLSAVQSEGNPYTHLVLRGSTASPNCDAPSVQHAMQLLRHAGLAPRVMLDCSHGNSGRQWERQKGVLLSALDQIEQGHCDLFGLMLESHLHSGNQVLREDPSSLRYAVSITDPCLDWETTEELVLQAHSRLSKREAPRAGVATLCTPPHCP